MERVLPEDWNIIGIIISCLVYFLIVIGINFRISRTIDRLYMVGILTIISSTAYDLIGYGSDRYYGNSTLMNMKGVSSIACGAASGRENSVDIEKTYQAADDRMYEHKKQMKKEKVVMYPTV